MKDSTFTRSSMSLAIPPDYRETQADVYSNGLDQPQIVVPTSSQENEQTNQQVTPQEVIAELNILPDPTLVKSILLLNNSKPQEMILGHRHDDGFFPQCASTSDGQIIFFDKRRDENIAHDLLHEWCHILYDAMPMAEQLYALACRIESQGYFVIPQARLSDQENWATHLSESVLSNDAKVLESFGQQAALRCTILGMALDWRLNANAETSDRLHRIVTYITEQVKPRARAILKDYLRLGHQHLEPASKLLTFIGEGDDFKQLTEPKSLNLHATIITKQAALNLANMKALESLNLSNCAFNCRIDEVLGGLPPVASLNLSGTKVHAGDFEHLAKIKGLLSLNLSETTVSDLNLDPISSLANLNSLNLRNTLVTNAGLTQLQEQLPNCQIII